MATLQVKGIDEALYKALGARAAMDNRSISQEVVAMIKEFLNRPQHDARGATMAFLELTGGWKDKKPAKEIAKSLRRARRSRRRFTRGADVFT